MDLETPVHDSRRLEILAEGLPLYGGVQLAIDTTLVSTLHCDGSARRSAAQIDGVVRADAKSALIPNWSAPGGAPGLWSLPVRLLDVGQTRHADSSVCSHRVC